MLRSMRRRAFLLSVVSASLRSEPTVNRILIVKSARTLTLQSGDHALKKYKIALGTQPIGPKEREGDHKTPEGEYLIDSKSKQSRFHWALHVSYPNALDRAHAKRLGVDPGGAVMIHGLENKYAFLGALHRFVDWTDGCVAVTNLEIEEIFNLVPVGTRVTIKP